MPTVRTQARILRDHLRHGFGLTTGVLSGRDALHDRDAVAMQAFRAADQRAEGMHSNQALSLLRRRLRSPAVIIRVMLPTWETATQTEPGSRRSTSHSSPKSRINPASVPVS
jgi:hypothetical protein